MEIPIIRGRQPQPEDPEYSEFMKYESGTAEREAAARVGPGEDVWDRLIETCEPGSRPSLEQALADPSLGPRIQGRVLDFGAGTCWATARLSRVAAVGEVVALDMSAGFFERVGAPLIRRQGGETAKVRFAASTFEHAPFPDGWFDVAFLIAALHHSLAPLRALREARRVLRNGGTLVVIESPSSLFGLARRRSFTIAESLATGTTEVAYTRGDLDYLIRHSGFAAPRCIASTLLSPNPLKRALRLALRGLGLEDVVLSVGYVIWAEASPRNP